MPLADPVGIMSDDVPLSELCDRYEALYTGVIADVLDERGFMDQVLDPGIEPIDPALTTAGAAFPVVGRANRSVDGDEQIRRFLEMLGDAPADSVVVYETRDDASAHIGELTTTALANAGCRGAVLDGGTRDTAFIREQGFPVFTRFKTPADSVPRWEVLDWDARATVGGVAIEPGDVVVGDVDGVVVVPREVAGDVLREAEAMVDTEDALRAAIRDGADPLAAYEEYGTF